MDKDRRASSGKPGVATDARTDSCHLHIDRCGYETCVSHLITDLRGHNLHPGN